MFASSTILDSSMIATSDRGGQAMLLLHSESAQRVVTARETSAGNGEKSVDTVSLSREGREKSQQQNEQPVSSQDETFTGTSSSPSSTNEQAAGFQRLTPEEEKIVQQLKQRDQEVKAHEMAHLAVAGQYARGGASYTYQQGPDGRRYAIGGEVPIDLSEEKTPEETMEKMETIKRAAMAPAQPSAADRSVSAAATAIENKARRELQAQESESLHEQTEETASSTHSSTHSSINGSGDKTDKPLGVKSFSTDARQSAPSIDLVA